MFLQRCNEYACLKGGAGMPSDLHCAGLYFACAVQKTTILYCVVHLRAYIQRCTWDGRWARASPTV